MVQQNCQEETANSENPLSSGNRPYGVKISVEKIQGDRGESQPAETTDDAEARADFWSIQGDRRLSSSQWTSSSTPRAEGRNIPYSTEIH